MRSYHTVPAVFLLFPPPQNTTQDKVVGNTRTSRSKLSPHSRFDHFVEQRVFSTIRRIVSNVNCCLENFVGFCNVGILQRCPTTVHTSFEIRDGGNQLMTFFEVGRRKSKQAVATAESLRHLGREPQRSFEEVLCAHCVAFENSFRASFNQDSAKEIKNKLQDSN